MTTEALPRTSPAFSHQAVLYRGLDDFVRQVAPFVFDGIADGEAVLVVDLTDRIAALEAALGPDAERVKFLDMHTIGRNPARIIAEWWRFIEEHEGEVVRGVGEPAWAGRRPDELVECQLHESLINVAFEPGPGWQLLCPYDVDALPEHVIDGARRTHPVVLGDAGGTTAYAGEQLARTQFTAELPAAPEQTEEIPFGRHDLAGLRSVVNHLAVRAGLTEPTVGDLVLATHEVACNSVEHGGGDGILRVWDDDEGVVVEIRDPGVIDDLLIGRQPAVDIAEDGRGVWIANQLCDLVQVRSSTSGTTVRLHTWH